MTTPLSFIDGIGGPELLLIFLIILVLFGGKGLPEMARGLARSLKAFKKAASGVEEEFKRAIDTQEPPRSYPPTHRRPASRSLETAPPPPAAPATPPEATPPAPPPPPRPPEGG